MRVHSRGGGGAFPAQLRRAGLHRAPPQQQQRPHQRRAQLPGLKLLRKHRSAPMLERRSSTSAQGSNSAPGGGGGVGGGGTVSTSWQEVERRRRWEDPRQPLPFRTSGALRPITPTPISFLPDTPQKYRLGFILFPDRGGGGVGAKTRSRQKAAPPTEIH